MLLDPVVNRAGNRADMGWAFLYPYPYPFSKCILIPIPNGCSKTIPIPIFTGFCRYAGFIRIDIY